MAPTSEDRPRLVCRCLGVSSPRIFAAVRSGGLQNVLQVTKAVKAGGGCGTCHPEIEEILADVAGDVVDPALRLENRLVCESEARNRVEGTIDSRIRPVLERRSVKLEDFTLVGLVVRVKLAGSVEEDVVRLVRDELRRFVCRDFEVEAEAS
jgi:NifU-like protein